MNRFHRLDLLLAWYREYLTINNYRPRTIKDYLFEGAFFRSYLHDHSDKSDIDDLDPDVLRSYTSWLYDRQSAPRTIHHKLAGLRNFFTALYTEHKLYIDFTAALIMPRTGKKLPTNILTEQEAALLFDYLEALVAPTPATETPTAATPTTPTPLSLDALLNIRDLALFEILYATGMRLSELIGLTLGDIAGADGTITIHDGKGGKDRVVPIGNKAVGAIGRYCSETRPFLTCSVVVTDRLFLNRWGRPIGQQGIRCIVNKHIRQAGITKHIRVHDVRHTCATHMLNSGADIRYVQELLGHASLSSTQVYTHVSITKLKETHTKHHPRERDTFLPPAESECNHGV